MRLPKLRLNSPLEGLLLALRERRRAWRLRRNKRCYLRALRSLVALERLDWPTLLDRQERLLPLPAEALAQKSSDGGDEAATVYLATRYEDWMHHPATQDFLGRCYLIQRNLGEAILRGDLDQHGHDRVEWLRGGYALANDIITIPAKIQAQREFVEREILGVLPNLSPPGA